MAHPLDAYFAADATAEQLVPVEPYSRGAVTRTEALWCERPVEGGVFDPQIFGPLDGSEERWGHIDVHGVTIAGKVVTRIPVPPIRRRMPSVVDDPAARALWHGPLNEAWNDLVAAVQSENAYARFGTAEELHERAHHTQHHFEDVLAAMRGLPLEPHHTELEDQPLAEAYLMMPCRAIEPAEPRGLVFLDEDRLVLQTSAGCRVIDRAGAALGPSWTPMGPLVTSIHGDLVVFNGGQLDCAHLYEDGAFPADTYGLNLGAYDLRARRWRMVREDDLPPWSIDEDGTDGSQAMEIHRDESFELVRDRQRATQLAQSRDARFVLVRLDRFASERSDPDDSDAKVIETASAIFEIATRRPFVYPTKPPRGLERIAVGQRTVRTLPAIHYGTGGWRMVDPSGAVADGERWWARLEGALIAAWSPGGTLAVIAPDDTRHDLVLFEVTPSGVREIQRQSIDHSIG